MGMDFQWEYFQISQIQNECEKKGIIDAQIVHFNTNISRYNMLFLKSGCNKVGKPIKLDAKHQKQHIFTSGKNCSFCRFKQTFSTMNGMCFTLSNTVAATPAGCECWHKL